MYICREIGPKRLSISVEFGLEQRFNELPKTVSFNFITLPEDAGCETNDRTVRVSLVRSLLIWITLVL